MSFSLRVAWARMRQISVFGSNVLLTMTTNLLLMGLAITTGSLAARLLGPTGRGELAAIQNWPALIATFGTLGVEKAVAYFCGREPKAAGRTLTTALALIMTLALPLMVLGYVLMPWLLAAQRSSIVHEARVYLLLIPIGFAVGLPYFVLQGRNDLLVWNILRVVQGLSWLLVLGLAALSKQATPGFVARTYLVALLFLVFAIAYVIWQRVPGPFRPDPACVKPLLHYGVPSILGSTSQQLNLRLDQLLMAALLAPQVLGLYAVAVAWSNGLTPIVNAIAAVAFPRLAGLSTHEEQAHEAARTLRFSALFTVALMVFMVSVTPLAIQVLFGIEFLPAIPAALVLVLAAGMASLSQVLEEILRGLGHPKYVAIAEMIGLLATIALLMLLLRPYQLMGAAVASLFSYGLILAVLVSLMRTHTGLSLAELLLPKMADVKLLVGRLRTAFSANQV